MKVRKCEREILFFRLGMNSNEVPPQKYFLGTTIKLKTLLFRTVRGTRVRPSQGIDKLTETLSILLCMNYNLVHV